MTDVELRDFSLQEDATRLADWVRQAHVARWWGEPSAVLAELAAHPVETMAVITVQGRPVGLLCWQIPSRDELAAAGLDDLPADLVDIDIMLGEPDILGQGLGPQALTLLFARLRGQGVRLVGLAAALANPRAPGAYAKAGFRPYRDFFEAGETYRYFTRWLDDGHEPRPSAPV